MKIFHKVSLAAAAVLFLTTGLLSFTQISLVRDSLYKQTAARIGESSSALARQIENWLNSPVLKDEFIQIAPRNPFLQVGEETRAA